MARVSTYLNFPRNTEEVFNYYKSIFGGEFSGGGVARFRDVPLSDEMPPIAEADKDLIMHIELLLPGGHILMGTDAPESMGFKVKSGNNIHINLEPDTRTETKRLFDALSSGGVVTMDLQVMFWGAYYGSCTDKYGSNGCSIAQKSKTGIINLNKMKEKEKIFITVQTKVNAPIEMVWKLWTTPKDIIHWNYASVDWHTIKAENDLRMGGKFNYRMEAKDGSFGFDFHGIYEKVINNRQIDILLGDDRKVKITFAEVRNKTEIIESFEAEDKNSVDLQRGGWQAILDNFKKYAEANNR